MCKFKNRYCYLKKKWLKTLQFLLQINKNGKLQKIQGKMFKKKTIKQQNNKIGAFLMQK